MSFKLKYLFLLKGMVSKFSPGCCSSFLPVGRTSKWLQAGKKKLHPNDDGPTAELFRCLLILPGTTQLVYVGGPNSVAPLSPGPSRLQPLSSS